LVSGKVIALDIDEFMVNYLREKIQIQNIKNIELIKRDFIEDGTGLDSNSIDYVMLFNILHHNQPGILLKEAYRILKPGGKLGIIHWNYDPTTPRGPPLDMRPKPEYLISIALQKNFVHPIQIELKPYHYGILVNKP
ncbi:MAG: class I SAM-dependent methyltransferase, partial [Candidatus Thorarchaeota archaeon]